MSAEGKLWTPDKSKKSEATPKVKEAEVRAALQKICQDRGHHEYVAVLVCRHCRTMAEMPKKQKTVNRKQRRRKR